MLTYNNTTITYRETSLYQIKRIGRFYCKPCNTYVTNVTNNLPHGLLIPVTILQRLHRVQNSIPHLQTGTPQQNHFTQTVFLILPGLRYRTYAEYEIAIVTTALPTVTVIIQKREAMMSHAKPLPAVRI